MTNNTSITAIIPIYNVEEYLIQCLDSVVAQSVPFDEVILINDGSTDKSLSICESYVLKYNFLKLFNQRNKGLSAARNVGINHAIGKYVIFLDSDDCLRLDAVKKLKEELNKFRYDAIYFDADIWCENGFAVEQNVYERSVAELNGVCVSGQEFFSQCYPEHYLVPVWTAVYRKNAIKDMKLRFPEGLFYEDNYFTFMFMNQAKYVTCISEKLYIRRYRKDSITTSIYSEKKFTDYIKIVLLMWDTIIQKKDDIFFKQEQLLLRFINDHCHIVLDNYKLCMEQGIVLGDMGKTHFCRMAETYQVLLEQYELSNDIINLPTINIILNNLYQFDLYYFDDKPHIKQIIKDVTDMKNQLYKQLLNDLLLNVKNCKVGIYGVGKHTDGMLALYESLIGKIKCDLVFIDSYIENGSYKNRKVINYQDIDKSFDLIIISSFLYEREMREKVWEANKEVPIYTFYEVLKTDIFSEFSLA